MIQLVVTYHNHQIMYFPVKYCWKIDSATRCIVIKDSIKHLPRQYIPLDNVAYWWVETLHPNDEDGVNRKEGNDV